MNRKLAIIFIFLWAAAGQAPDSMPKPVDRYSLPPLLTFEAARAGEVPRGWDAIPRDTVFADDKVLYDGHWSARIERKTGGLEDFSAIEKSVEVDFEGRQIEVRGVIRSEDLKGTAGLYVRENGDAGPLLFDNMQNRRITGTTAWAPYSIVLPLKSETKLLSFGFAASGTGKAWVADMQVFVDGKAIAQTPRLTPGPASGITINQLTTVQIANLATLGKVWGFLKYHHPLVTAGKRDWDKDLFGVLPAILAARDAGGANAAMVQWIHALGPIEPCKFCGKLEDADLQLPPEIAWIEDGRLGAELGPLLRSIYAVRVRDQQAYAMLTPQIGNVILQGEPAYKTILFPDAGYQLLALFRFWNVIEYWSPYRNLIGENWDDALGRFIPRLALAKTRDAYQLELMQFAAEVHDNHANLWSSLDLRPPTGACALPVRLRFIEGQAVVIGFDENDSGKAMSLQLGDAVTALDGTPVSELVKQWTSYYAASNEASRLRDMARFMTRGACGDAKLTVQREHGRVELTEKRLPLTSIKLHADTHDLPGEPFRLLSGQVAYLKLSGAKSRESTHYVEAAAATKGFIVDIRNYPSNSMTFWLGCHFVEKKTEFARFTTGDLSNPGAFYWKKPLAIDPLAPHYAGKIVILADEVTQSQAEYTVMAFRSSPQAIIVGSQTAGADGNVSPIPLPGAMRALMSGVGVFYADRKPTQRTGIVPDVEVRPTIAGTRAGRDEVLEEAIRRILGPGAPEAEIRRLAKPAS